MAAIGSIEDVNFLTATFKGADAAYCMLPPFNFFNPEIDLGAHIRQTATNYTQAIEQSGVKRVIHLSSIGAHTDTGNGILFLHNIAENVLRELPSEVSITHMRPTAFYYNLNNFIPTIKSMGSIISNYGGEDVISWVSPFDIASAVAEEITAQFNGRRVRYVSSEEISCNEIAHILGAAIGKPDLKWITVSDEQILSGLKSAGWPLPVATGFVEMNARMHSGELFKDYYRLRPASLGKTKMMDYSKDFAAAYNQ